MVIDQLDEKTISVPEDLDFECEDRLQLLDQLELLQKVMRKSRSKTNKSQSGATEQSLPEKSLTQSPSKNTSPDGKKEKKSDELIEKVERYKEAQLKKRKSKLESMDDQADMVERKKFESPSKKSNNSNQSPEAKSSSSFSQTSSNDKSRCSSLSSSGKSVLESLSESRDRAVLRQKKDATIARMIQAGHKINLVPEGGFALKYALSSPYHYFLNRVEKEIKTYDQQYSVTFPELLDCSLGEIVDSLHINFMVEIGWLCLQYLFSAQSAKMTIFCGEVCDSPPSLPPNIKLVQVEVPGAFGCHHSKVSVLRYKDNGIRVIVSTANLYTDDWENRTQG